ncbi:MAG TPA: phosphoribosylaminoimidazolesuccinocarboxamide synthase [Cyanobacteria bacterium UBA8530]|nr:phosphoribosylaminoimidazolesuccinocarboxamide synthase [Cyanobacteria bacterium UBA8530]
MKGEKMKIESIKERLEGCLGKLDLPELGEVDRGKVRDCYELKGRRLIVATDRVSAFDRVFDELIPFKGQVLNQLAAYFLRQAEEIIPTHLIETPDPNVTLAKEAKVFPVEVIVRGYLTGSAWRDHENECFEKNYGLSLPAGLVRNSKLSKVIVTPTTKSNLGHDLPIDRAEAARLVGGRETWDEIERVALALFRQGSAHAEGRGLILVDTKYEFGLVENRLTLIDELHTPDSSRYWYLDSFEADPQNPRQLSKEFLREWLRAQGFEGEGPLPVLGEEIRTELSLRYLEVFETLTGREIIEKSEKSESIESRITSMLRERGYLGGLVSILMGSASDGAIADKVVRTLERFGVASRVEVASAHKVPERVLGIIEKHNRSPRPIVHITIAGRSNGLSGVAAANSVHPVIALPAFKDQADYLVNIHSSLQLPSETPALTVIDPQNAAMAAIRILSHSDENLRKRVLAGIAEMKSRFND